MHDYKSLLEEYKYNRKVKNHTQYHFPPTEAVFGYYIAPSKSIFISSEEFSPDDFGEWLQEQHYCILCDDVTEYMVVFTPPPEKTFLYPKHPIYNLNNRYLYYGICKDCYEIDDFAEQVERKLMGIASQQKEDEDV
jgi:hypothetical protein